MNIPTTLIIMGRSGSGKGTQINLLKEAYRAAHADSEILHFEPGNLYRSIVKSDSYSGKKVKELTSAGKLVPDFITNGLFISHMVDEIVSDEQLLIFDGYPRSVNQAEFLDQGLKYYGREEATVVHFHVSEAEVRARLAARGRGDDVDESALNTRIEFYNKSVLPSIEWYKNHPDYTYIEVNGEGDIDTIQQSIITALQK